MAAGLLEHWDATALEDSGSRLLAYTLPEVRPSAPATPSPHVLPAGRGGEPAPTLWQRRGGMTMKSPLGMVLVALGILAVGPVRPAVAAEERAACPPELSRAHAMVAKAQDVMKGGSGSGEGRTTLTDPGSGPARTPQGDPTAVAGRTPLLDQGTGTARALATSAASDINPWNPQPTDKTLKARTLKAARLTAQADKLCNAGKMDGAKAKAVEAIGVLNPK